MGSDIHGVVQKRWKQRSDEPEPHKWETVARIDDTRNYLFFAIIGNVRNGYGFAGVETHKPIDPVSDCRGLPDDFKVDKSYDHHFGYDGQQKEWMGDHSHSWVTLRELLDWPGWDRSLKETGVVTREEYQRMQSSGEKRPRLWCGGVAGGDTLVVDDPAIALASGAKWTHTRVEWSRTCREALYNVTRCWLDYIAAKWETDIEEARLVFGFDS